LFGSRTSRLFIDLGMEFEDCFIHESSYVDQPCEIGAGTKIWHFSHIMKDCHIGRNCNIGQNVSIASGVIVGNNVKIQNNVSLYSGCILEDDVFCGPSSVFTNVTNPRSQVPRQHLYEKTLIRRGASIGANATIVCGVTIGRYSFVGAGAVVAGDVADYALMLGVPARRDGWMSRHGHRMVTRNAEGEWLCPETGWRYRERPDGGLSCVDWDEEATLAKK
jgi:UDP-2-acetamido-3-amino-2,3-dideoxy-glucuronate N-acetyltransferase